MLILTTPAAAPWTPAFRSSTAQPQDQFVSKPRPALFRPDTEAFIRQSKRAVIDEIVKLDNLSPEARNTIAEDLEVFSLPVLRLLRDDGLTIVGVAPGQNLADSGWYDPPSPERYKAMLDRGRDLLEHAERELEPPVEEDPVRAEMARRWAAGEGLVERVRPALERAELNFQAIALHPDHDLDVLAGEHGVAEPAEKALWKQAFERLNGDHTARRMALLPYSYHRGMPIPEEQMNVALAKNDAYVEEALGIHNWQERIIILHESYVVDPAPEVGHYRVAIHEVGHAVDHALERALGPSHRQTVDRLYREDQDYPERFLTERASHNVREYFAEAIEAFFTLPTGDDHDSYKKTCNRAELRKRRPELYDYLERALSGSWQT